MASRMMTAARSCSSGGANPRMRSTARAADGIASPEPGKVREAFMSQISSDADVIKEEEVGYTCRPNGKTDPVGDAEVRIERDRRGAQDGGAGCAVIDHPADGPCRRAELED